MINIIERFNLTWENAEKNKYTINYKDEDGNNRTYRADFLINNKYLVDCKPKSLHNSSLNKLKKEAAIEFCNGFGFKFKFTEIPRLSDQEFKYLKNNNKIKFIERYEKKFKERYASDR